MALCEVEIEGRRGEAQVRGALRVARRAAGRRKRDIVSGWGWKGFSEDESSGRTRGFVEVEGFRGIS